MRLPLCLILAALTSALTFTESADAALMTCRLEGTNETGAQDIQGRNLDEDGSGIIGTRVLTKTGELICVARASGNGVVLVEMLSGTESLASERFELHPAQQVNRMSIASTPRAPFGTCDCTHTR